MIEWHELGPEEMSDESQCGLDSESTLSDNLTGGLQDGTDSEEVLSESTDEEVISPSSDESDGVPKCKRQFTRFLGQEHS